ncbi:MAG TPA: PolC-type DNA polymerase III N-terminal domain-containing protein, partial [Clostridia bacterium]
MHSTIDKKRLFKDVFYEITMGEELFDSFNNALISNVKFNKKSGRLEIHLELPGMVRIDRVFNLEESLSSYFNVPVLVIPHFEVKKIDSDFINNYNEDLVRIMAGQSKHYACLLEKAEFVLEGTNLNVCLSTNGSLILQAGDCHKELERFFKTCFGQNICVSFTDPPFDENDRDSYIKDKTIKEAEAVKNIVYSAEKTEKDKSRISDSKSVYKSKSGSNTNVILGKAFKDEAVPMSEVTIDSGRITVKGKVIRVETRLLKNGKTLFSFD